MNHGDQKQRAQYQAEMQLEHCGRLYMECDADAPSTAPGGAAYGARARGRDARAT
jgi:hypothetical protein